MPKMWGIGCYGTHWVYHAEISLYESREMGYGDTKIGQFDIGDPPVPIPTAARLEEDNNAAFSPPADPRHTAGEKSRYANRIFMYPEEFRDKYAVESFAVDVVPKGGWKKLTWYKIVVCCSGANAHTFFLDHLTFAKCSPPADSGGGGGGGGASDGGLWASSSVQEDLRQRLVDSGLANMIALLEEHQVYSLAMARQHLTDADLQHMGVKVIPRRALLAALRDTPP